jgi:ATP-dependent HslUV protease subunit HslV
MEEMKVTEGVRATTILSVRKDGRAVVAGDGQVSLGETIMKQKAVKVRFMFKGRVLTGFAGAAADAFNLFEKLEGKLEKFNGNLARAAVELAKDWRTDKILRRLEALLLAMDESNTLIISGTGDVIEPDEPVAAIGSGGPYALAAAKALMAHSDLDAPTIAKEALKITASICLYTNDQIVVHEIGESDQK